MNDARTHSQNTAKGREGEARAAAYLEAKGYHILARNFHSPLGELDIVAFDPLQKALVCVEVKLWSTGYYPLDDIRYVISGMKRKRLLGGFSEFIASNAQLRYDYSRVDVISIVGDETFHFEGVC